MRFWVYVQQCVAILYQSFWRTMCLAQSTATMVPFTGEFSRYPYLYAANFSSSTLSHDFYQVMVGSQSMSLHGWRVLAEWNLEHSCMNTLEKFQTKKRWLDSWNEFCQWIINEYDRKYPSTSRPSS